MRQHLLIFASTAAFLGASWLIYALPELAPEIHHYRIFLAGLGLLTLLYVLGLYLTWRQRRVTTPWWVGAVAAFIMTFASPVLYETDPLRYYWDGLSVVRGESPYVVAPKDHPQFAHTPWAQQLNYPELPTIYPPGAAALFGLATLANPFFYDSSSFSAASWPAVHAAKGWQAAWGWKLVMGALAAAVVFVWRIRRWDLILFHPLFLTKFALNVHIDGVLMLLLLLAFAPGGLRSQPWRSGLWLGLSIATKWITVLLLPFLALHHWHRARHGLVRRPLASLAKASQCVVAAAAVTALAIAVGQWGAEGKFLFSFKKFASDWLFFGFWQRWAMDALQAFGAAEPLKLSKIFGYCGILVAYAAILLAFAARSAPRPSSAPSGGVRQGPLARLTLPIASSIALMAFFSGLPVINPWYLLTMLPFALEVRQRLVSPLVLTLTVSASAMYYDGYEDPLVSRYTAYLLVVAAMAFDLRSMARRLSSRSAVHVQ